MEKILEIRQNFPKTVASRICSCCGRIVYEHYDQLVEFGVVQVTLSLLNLEYMGFSLMKTIKTVKANQPEFPFSRYNENIDDPIFQSNSERSRFPLKFYL